jgi:hypothetical protein
MLNPMLIPAIAILGAGLIVLVITIIFTVINRDRGVWKGPAAAALVILTTIGFLAFFLYDKDPLEGSLLGAVRDRNAPEVKRLLSLGADPDFEYEGMTPREEAQQYPEIAKLMPPKSNTHRTPSVE